MNVFVLNTGRCGSTTFIKACRHITNFTCGHESRTAALGADRLAYPDNHIEADNRLSWLLGRLDAIYGDNAVYVHLKRDIHDTARSYARRYSNGIMKAYKGDGILAGLSIDNDPFSVALDYCHTVNSNIELFLKDKTKKMEIHLEDMDRDFVAFWDFIGAEGEIRAAMVEFSIHYNAAQSRQRSRKWKTVPGILRKIGRLAARLPDYIRNT